METIFTRMSEYQKEMIFKFGEVTVQLEKQDEDEYKINIDPGSYDFKTGNGNDCTEYCNLKYRIVSGNFNNNNWWIKPDYFNIEFNGSGYFKNDSIFDAKHINHILQSIKSSVEFIQAHGGSIRDVMEEIVHIGKMTLKSKKIGNDVYQCSIDGMKLSGDVNEYWVDDEIRCVAFRSGEFTISNYKGEHATKHLVGEHFKFSLYTINYTQGYVPLKGFKVTEAELKELKELLQECSDRLHKLNEPTPSALDTKEKMTIKVTPVGNDMVVLEITGMDDPGEFGNDEEDYSMCARYWKDDNTICLYGEEEGESLEIDGCDAMYNWIYIGPKHPMTKNAAQEIITYLGASAAKLHTIRHKDEEYTLVL